MSTQAPQTGKWPTYPAYKPSGIDWLGEVPEHWEVSRLKYAVAYMYSGGTPETNNSRYWAYDDADEGVPWVAIRDMTRSALVSKTDKRVTQDGLASKKCGGPLTADTVAV